ncbi:class I SAM-dependent methyltransferase [Nocardia sp. BSTN01]|uniref:class I SAM-dependent methyltransferase n=1 Tax=Nocardia sp. BSTN01 TaxID=2783665 RepID=UPI00188DDDEF|nr:class I SAM-dependent methyltransferase [Nocardia sp. BSTN01]MBF4998201.1 class I SAM-dependent methyltransferase [Nocardia sp. BSTN01]
MLGDEPISDAYAANAEFWIRIVRDDLDPYRSGLTDPALLALIGDCTGLHILDAGCGEGCLTRELTTRGAGFVHGVDTCAEFVAAAASHPAHDPARARFRQADVAALPLPDDSVDLVVANRLPHGLSDPGRRFVEFARVVRPAGRLVMMTMHPCFYVARGERSCAGTGFTIGDYFAGRAVQQRFEVAGTRSPAASVQALYSLETTIGMLTTAGFAITAVREPRPTDRQRRDNPWWDEHFTRPLFLLLECVPL